VSQANQFGFEALAACHKGQSAVVESAAHTHAVAVTIKGYQRHKNDIQAPGGSGPLAMEHWFWNTKAICHQFSGRIVMPKVQFIFLKRMQYWQKAGLTGIQSSGQNRAGVYFAIISQINTNALSAQEKPLTADYRRQVVAAKPLLFRGQSAPFCAKLLSGISRSHG
jgi:hypothetical protein